MTRAGDSVDRVITILDDVAKRYAEGYTPSCGVGGGSGALRLSILSRLGLAQID
jgi:hypothetical protein